MFKQCPGVKDMVSPRQVMIRTCPKCRGEVEFFGDDLEVKCPTCGRSLHREVTNTCIVWCQYALQCIADINDKGLISNLKAEELKKLALQKNLKLK